MLFVLGGVPPIPLLLCPPDFCPDFVVVTLYPQRVSSVALDHPFRWIGELLNPRQQSTDPASAGRVVDEATKSGNFGIVLTGDLNQ